MTETLKKTLVATATASLLAIGVVAPAMAQDTAGSDSETATEDTATDDETTATDDETADGDDCDRDGDDASTDETADSV